MPYPSTVSTDASGAAIELIIISDAVYTGCCATENSCRVQLMTYWHKFKMIFNSFVVFSVDRPREDNVRCVSLLLFHRRLPLLFLSAISIFLSSLNMCTDERSLLCIMSRHAPYCWLATSLFWYPDSMTERLREPKMSPPGQRALDCKLVFVIILF